MNETHIFVNAIDSGLKCKNFGLNPEFFNFYFLDILKIYKVNYMINSKLVSCYRAWFSKKLQELKSNNSFFQISSLYSRNLRDHTLITLACGGT